MADFEFITQADIEQAEKEIEVPKFGPLGDVVDTRTYRRFLKDKGRRETFFERNARTTNYSVSLALGSQTTNELQEEAELLYSYMNQLKVWPSGRTQWVGGTDCTRENSEANFNCSFLAINRPTAFKDVATLLMLGVGVGYRVHFKDIDQLPEIFKGKLEVRYKSYTPLQKSQRQEETIISYRCEKFEDSYQSVCEVVIGDSRNGWTDTIQHLINIYFQLVDIPKVLIFNFDSVRPIGERIKGFGGTASGPEALEGILKDIVDIFEECPDRKLRSVDCMDIVCSEARGIIAGSSRRSALIGLGQEGDLLFRNAKIGLYTNPALAKKSYRSQSNNTENIGSNQEELVKAFAIANPDLHIQHPKVLEFIQTFAPSKEKLTEMFESVKTEGEPGFDNWPRMQLLRFYAARQQRPQYTNEEIWERYCNCGTNPSLRSDTLVATTKGIFPVENLVGGFHLTNHKGEIVPAFCRMSSPSETLWEIKLENGTSLFSSEQHLWPVNGTSKPTSELVKGDTIQKVTNYTLNQHVESSKEQDIQAFIQGWFFGDGWTTTRKDNRLQVGGVVNYEEYVTIGKYVEENLGVKFNRRDNGTYEFNTSKKSVLTNLSIGSTQDKSQGILQKLATKSHSEICNFITGLFLADGCFSWQGKSKRLQISTSREQVAKDLQSILGFLGIYVNIKASSQKLKGYDKTYYRYEVVINRKASIKRFLEILTTNVPSAKIKKLSEWVIQDTDYGNERPSDSIKVVSVQKTELVEPVYDITVFDEYHLVPLSSCLTGNCHEILLNTGVNSDYEVSFCNLTSVPLINHLELKDGNYIINYLTLETAIRLATRIGLRQTCVEMSQERFSQTQLDERLLGVSFTGLRDLMDAVGWKTEGEEIKAFLSTLKAWANNEADCYAEKLGVPRPLLVTTLKPEGTFSKVVGASNGVHYDWAPYYIQRIRMSGADALAKTLLTQGITAVPEVYDLEKLFPDLADVWSRIETFKNLDYKEQQRLLSISNTIVFEFPVKSVSKTSQGKASVKEQLQNIDNVTKYYVDHMTSNTITVTNDDWPVCVDWIVDNWANYTTASFLPYYAGGDYPLLPFEQITEEQYEKLVSKIPDTSRLVDDKGRYFFVVDQDLLTKFEREIEDPDDADVETVAGSCGLGGAACPLR